MRLSKFGEHRVPGVAHGAHLGDTHCVDAPWDGGGCVVLLIWPLRVKKTSHANVSFVFDFVTTRFASRQLGGVDEAIRGRYVLRGIHVPRAWYRGQRPSRPDSCLGQRGRGL